MQSARNIHSPTAPLIAAVAKESPAAAAGIVAGDRLASIANARVRDCVDYKFLCADDCVEVGILKPDGARRTITIEKHPDEDLGLDFRAELFDGIRRCRNQCMFCFYDQLPKGLRESLYIRDDDFRLSFLHGNFITLTNVADEDFARIAAQRLSPLYVSVHATEPGLRRRLLGNLEAADVVQQMRRLGDCGIEMHAQVVLCPGLNDGAALSRTIADLAALHPAVASVAIVPVGLTRHRAGLPHLRPVDAAVARDVLCHVTTWQGDFLTRLGSRFVFAADEIYLLAGVEFPASEEYEGFPQRENGIGLARIFLDELDRADFRRAAGMSVGLVTGVAASELVEKMAARMREHGVRAEVIVVHNRLFGKSVTVAGLLSGEDIAGAIAGRHVSDVIALPSSTLREGEFLDDVKTEGLSRRLGKRIIPAAGPRELARKLARAPQPPRGRAAKKRCSRRLPCSP